MHGKRKHTGNVPHFSHCSLLQLTNSASSHINLSCMTQDCNDISPVAAPLLKFTGLYPTSCNSLSFVILLAGTRLFHTPSGLVGPGKMRNASKPVKCSWSSSTAGSSHVPAVKEWQKKTADLPAGGIRECTHTDVKCRGRRATLVVLVLAPNHKCSL